MRIGEKATRKMPKTSTRGGHEPGASVREDHFALLGTPWPAG